ncbi:hypothetical protein BH10PSE7_BH10PSE7_03800 [soil metagenome]
MRRGLTIMLLIAGLLAPTATVLAQAPRVQIQMQPKIRIQPNIVKPQGVKPQGAKPPMMKPIIPPSVAAQAIMNAMPGAKVLKLRNLPTGDIVGTVRIQNQLRNIRVNGQTGAVRP